ncbi:MAG: glycerol-3-phosphate dehydrogenase [Gemmatimonadetes bacterium]|nr:MAG: glycerol-3-phosphate dehydrogenase [Gemmatimonadota bacterium]
MTAEPVDVLVIGGGITGAGIARDAALRGLRTAVVDKGDLGGGTSSLSSRLVHGGIRYLEHGEFRLVFEASRERHVLLGIAPHLVHPLPFLFPVYRGARIPAWKLRAGMWLYDLLAAFHNVKAHRWLGRKATQRLEPGLKDKDLKGAALYYDAQTDDARLVIATMRSAAQAGALVASYAEATALLKPDGRVGGATVRDGLTSHTSTVRALVVVNAAGPWVDRVRRLDDARAEPLLRPTKGVHVAVPRTKVGHVRAVTLTSPIDGRVMFVLPWDDLSYIGTTDSDEDTSPDEVRATADDVVYLLRSANAFFPHARLAPPDVIASWAGLRPLLRPPSDVAPSAASREHRVVESPSGLLTIAGGKLTTYRIMARDVVDRVAARLRELDGRPRAPHVPTDRLPLPGGETADLEGLVKAALERGSSDRTARHLVGAYGSESAAVLNLVDRDRALGQPIVAGRATLWAEVAHAVEREMAVRLSDVLVRRLHLFYATRDQALPAASPVADWLGEALGWDATRRAEEVAAYVELVERSRAFAKEAAGVVEP